MVQCREFVQRGKSENLLVSGIMPKMLDPMIGVRFYARTSQQHRRSINQNSHFSMTTREVSYRFDSYSGFPGSTYEKLSG